MFLLSIFLFLFACNQKKVCCINTMKQGVISAPDTEIKDDCKKVPNGYFKKFGVFISNFYAIDQSININNDSIGILKPFYTYSLYSYCYPEKTDKNLLIIYHTKKNKTDVYKNILFSDDRNVYQELKPNGNGFIIYSEQGNSSKLFSSIFISGNKVDSIKIESWGFDQYSETYKFRNLYLKQYQTRIIDSIQDVF